MFFCYFVRFPLILLICLVFLRFLLFFCLSDSCTAQSSPEQSRAAAQSSRDQLRAAQCKNVCVGWYFPEPGHRSQTSSPLEILKIIHLKLLTEILMVLIEKVKG